MNIQDLKLRNSSKKNLTRKSKQASQYDFVVKTGIKQDDVEFMSIFDTPLSLEDDKNISLGDYLIALQEENNEMHTKMEELKVLYSEVEGKYQTLEDTYNKILEMGAAEYVKMLLSL